MFFIKMFHNMFHRILI